jgi:ABC-2 type transport system permease protein
MRRAEWIGFWTLFKKEIMRFSKVAGQTIFSPLVNAGLYLLVFGVSFSSMLKMHEDFSYLAFLIPGLVALSALNNAIQNSSSSIMISKFHGDLQDLKIVPLSPTAITSAYIAASIIRGVLVGLLVLTLGEVIAYLQSGNWLQLGHPAQLIVFLALSCSIFGSLGITSAILAKTFDQINTFINFIVLPLIYLGGVFFSLKILHPIWQEIARYNPVIYMINGVRWSILGVSDVQPTTCVIVLSIFALATAVVARIAVRYGSYQRF